MKTTLGPGVAVLPGGGGIFKSAAVAVLRMERRLMTTGEITRVALSRGLINCQGKTPEATMASALYTDVKRKQGASVFTRPQEGLFGLREWDAEGFVPDNNLLVEVAVGHEPSPVKRIRTGTRQATKQPRKYKEDFISRLDSGEFYEAESPPRRVLSARIGSYSETALMLLSACS
eukprot:jgi/Astpho2/532/Aster-x0023